MTVKKFILAAIVLGELLVGSLFLFHKWHAQSSAAEYIAPEEKKYISKLNKEDLIFITDKYSNYFMFRANNVMREQPIWLEHEARYTINNDGFNDRFDYPLEKEEGVLRIITLGDSFTYGHYVSTEFNWSEQLEDMLNSKENTCGVIRFEVINLGMPGFDIPYIVERYKQFGAKYNPDIILWMESRTGFDRFRELNETYIDECSEKLGGDDVLSTEQWDDCWEKANKAVTDNYSQEELNAILLENLTEFFSIAKPENVVYFTFEEDLITSKGKKLMSTWQKDFPQAQFITIIPDLGQTNGFLPDGHPNATGHTEIAQDILAYLTAEKLNTCFAD